MSDTPRTDAVLASYFNPGPSRLCDLARELERELNSANAAIRQQELLIEENLRLKERIKRLEEHSSLLTEAGNEVFWSLCPSSPSMMTEREIDALKAWNKAKEAKP